MDPLLPPFREAVRLAQEDVTSLRHLHQVLAWREEVQRRAWHHISPQDDPRPRAQSARRRAIAQLSDLIDRLEQRCEANGIRVHRAASGEEATARVLTLARALHPRAIAYVRHDILEEVGAYTALVQAGLPVADVDLGGYLLRLMDDLPAHPLVPLAHLSARDVALAWQENTGQEVHPTPDALVAAIRARVRTVLARASVGVVGATFAVAETGTLVFADDEGQGALTATLPPALIVLLPIDRVVASWQDLGPLLETLARARVAAPAHRHVALVHSAAHRPQNREVHLILVDNGRSQWAETDLAEALTCIGCAACVDVCPLYRAVGGQAYNSPYMGPVGAIFAALLWPKTHGDIAMVSPPCTTCADVCPMDIDLPAQIARVRGWLTRHSRQSLLERLLHLLPWKRRDTLPLASPPLPSRASSQVSQHEVGSVSEPAAAQMAPVDVLSNVLRARGVDVYRAPTAVAARLHIASQRQEWTPTTVGGWDEERMGMDGLADALAAVGVSLLGEASALQSDGRIARAWFAADVGIVSATAAIADTGTLVIASEPPPPLVAGIAPRRVVVMLPARGIYPTWDSWASTATVNDALLLSGPSRTFTVGGKEVNAGLGPEHIHVIIVEEEERG